MFHATFMMILTCFIHTLCHYYAFSGTNLLTRCQRASCCFLLFLVPGRLFGQYSRNSTKRKPNILIHRDGPEHRRGAGEEAQGPQTIGPRGLHPGRAGLWGGSPGALPTPPLRLFNPSEPKNPTPIDETPERLHGRRRHRETPFWGTEVSVPAPCRDGEVPPEGISIDTTAIFIDAADSYDEEGVVLPRG